MVKYYYVGGYVRDKLLNVKNKDIDFAVEAPSYEAMREDLLSKGVVIYQERPEFLSIRGGHPELGGVDYTLCRTEGFYSDARHPDNVAIGTIYDDLKRRDFTINAMAIDADTGELIDPHEGRIDLKRNILRCVGKTEDRFNEDGLRLLRAVRFHVVRGFVFDDDIRLCLHRPDILETLNKTSKERIYEELRLCYEHNSFGTMMFFKEFPALELLVFGLLGIKLMPVINSIRPGSRIPAVSH